MTYAYDETYLDDAMNNLGDMFDYAVNDCGYEVNDFWDYFIVSGVSSAIEKGNPKYVAGLSGPELASEVLNRTFNTRPDTPPAYTVDKSPEYWAGWILAYYQWITKRSFTDMEKNALTIERVLSLYPTLHEADVSKFVSVADNIIAVNVNNSPSNLQRIRKASGKTQKELAKASGVSLRMIQLYEQRQHDINKMQAKKLQDLARSLGCSAEALLEG